MDIIQFIKFALDEDTGSGDHTSIACINDLSMGEAELLIKDTGIIAGIEASKMIFNHLDPDFHFENFVQDGQEVSNGEVGFIIKGKQQLILRAERLVLNTMQRMSGIATETSKYIKKLHGLQTKVLDTRKTTPLFREFEKWAVRIGGGENHRMGLYDMIMIKDNHIDYSGGIVNAIEKVEKYLLRSGIQLKIEVETRNLSEVEAVLQKGGVNRIMLDNFNIKNLADAVKMINHKFETEASGGITIENIRSYAETGVDFISIGSLTHSYKSFDFSLKAKKNKR